MNHRETRRWRPGVEIEDVQDVRKTSTTAEPLRLQQQPLRQRSDGHKYLITVIVLVMLSTQMQTVVLAEAKPEAESYAEGESMTSDSQVPSPFVRSRSSQGHGSESGSQSSHSSARSQQTSSGQASSNSPGREYNYHSYSDDGNHVVGANDYDETDYDLGPCGSDNCTGREIKRRYRYASIRTDILRKLRLTTTPNITGRHLPAIPDLHSTINRMCRQKDVSCNNLTSSADHKSGEHESRHRYPPTGDQDDVDDYHATTVKVLLFPAYGNSQLANPNVVRFNVQPDSVNGEIVNVTLGIFLRRPSVPESSDRFTWLLVYRRNGTNGTERLLIHKKRINLSTHSISSSSLLMRSDGYTNEWQQIKLHKSIVSQWLRYPANNYGLEIQVADGRGLPLAITEPSNDEEQLLKPYLEIHVRSGRQTARPKRQLGDLDCDDLSLESRCCRYPLVVDFDSFGWDWVIVPRRYSAYYCSGECPFLYYQTQGHQHVRQQQAGEGSAATGGPCCSPKRVSAISMLYYDEHMNIVHGRLPGMVVEQCGCS